MAKANPSVHQFEPFRVPSNWKLQEKKFVQQVEDTLLDLYGRFNRLRITDMAPAFRQEYTDNLGHVSQLQLTAEAYDVRISDAEGSIGQLTLDSAALSARMETAEGDVGALQLTSQQFGVRMTDAEQNVGQLTLTANSLTGRMSSAEGDIGQLQLSAQSFGVRMTSAEGDIGQLTLTSQGFATRITGVENTNTTQQTEINQNKAQILLRAEKTVTDGLNTRLTSAEQKITPDAITATVRSHANYQSDLSAKNRTFVGGTPTGMIAGDLWIDSANGNLLKRYNGSAWAAVQDGAISIAQQQADKIQWLVASGTSAANMTLTSQLYSLMAENINLSANNSIKLAVSGGTNLLPNSNDVINWDKRTSQTSLLNVGDMVRVSRNAGDTTTVGVETPGTFKLAADRQYTISYNSRSYYEGTMNYLYLLSAGGNIHINAANQITLGKTTDLISGTYYGTRYAVTFTCPRDVDDARILFGFQDGTAYATATGFYLSKAQIECGTQATDWSPAPSDPASGVKTPYITLDALGMEIQGGADFRLYAGSGATSIGLANKRADGTFIFAGGADPATSPLRVGMDGAIRATKGQIGGFTLEAGRMAAPGVGGIDFALDWANAELSLGGFRVYSTPLGFVMVNRRTTSSTGAEARIESLYSGVGLYGPSNSVISIGTQSQRFGLISANGASLFVGLMANTVSVNNDIYISNNCSALSFTDRTPAYIGNALDELRWTRGSRAKGIDHNTLPPFARKRIQGTREMPDGTMVPVEEEARDLGAMISILTKAVQELDEKTMALERRLPA